MWLVCFINIVVLASDHNSGRSSAQEFYLQDPTGFGMSVIAMSVVFTALLLLFFAVSYISRIINREIKKKTVLMPDGSVSKVNSEPLSGEVNAAIALAIHLYKNQLHDMESFKLTIDRVSRIYSPWSSKYYNMMKAPQKRSR